MPEKRKFSMKSAKSKTSRSLSASTLTLASPALALLLLAGLSPASADQGQDNRAPAVPAALQVPDGNKVQFHAYAVGVQIYTCKQTGTDAVGAPVYGWVFKAPVATLYDSDGNVVGRHYAGPTWESESGSTVVGARVAGVTVNATAIPWLLLKAKSSEGPGIFANISYIQRVHTAGGLAPATECDATDVGMEMSVPYTAEYFFYREK